jgi:hypothetical protein
MILGYSFQDPMSAEVRGDLERRGEGTFFAELDRLWDLGVLPQVWVRNFDS